MRASWGYRIPERLFADQANLNLISNQIHGYFLDRARRRDEALRAKFAEVGWRQWIEIHTDWTGQSWRIVTRRPKGAIDWLKHKRWAFRVCLGTRFL